MSKHDALYIAKFQPRRSPRKMKAYIPDISYVRKLRYALNKLAKKAGVKPL